MLAALGANILVLLQIFFPDDLAATLTLHPQAFGADILFARSVQLAGLSSEPSHENLSGDLVIGSSGEVRSGRS
jgi:hypothetical protein